VALSDDEIDLISKLRSQLDKSNRDDELKLRYYLGRQRIEQLGMAIPPEMRRFVVVTNWCRTLVDTINDRQQVRSLILPGEETADPRLRAIWDANNLSAHVSMFNADRLIYGRAFMSVGTNEDEPELPLVRVESPRQMSALVDVRRERMIAAGRFYRSEGPGKKLSQVTLYLPNATVWAERQGGKWVELDRDEHSLGVVPVVMHLNRRMSGGWTGESQMTDLIPLVDSATRSLTNLQFAQEAHGVPSIWATGVAAGDFVDDKGDPIPQFEAYFDAIKMLSKEGAKWGQFTAADLKNFETSLDIYRTEASTTTGLPPRLFGLLSSQPPQEGGIRADEASLVRSIESQNEQVGMTIGWAGGLAYRFATGDEVSGNRVRVDWFDVSTPTVSQREDALAKRHASGALSTEGYWDELGWSEARKAKEREYLRIQREAEALDPIAAQVLRGVNVDADVSA
jgi:hypothetical protein